MPTYTLYLYDVWGNAKDGFDVNDIYRTDTRIEVDDTTSNQAINRRLNAHGIIWSGIEYCEEYDAIFGTDKTGKPIGELRHYL